MADKTATLHHRAFLILSVVLVFTLVPLTGCTSRVEQIPAGPLSVKLSPPSGWVTRNPEPGQMIVAQKEADIGAALPGGPRVVVRRAGSDVPEAGDLKAASDKVNAPSGGTVTEDPVQIKVGLADGVAITVKEGEGGRWFIRRYVVANAGAGRVFSIVLEAPEDQWTGAQGALNQMLQSAKFERSS